jgi:probable F420-dependent oxidoreductase
MAPVSGVMTAGDQLSPSALVDHARWIERLGYDSVWLTDVFGREIYVTAGYVLAHTSRLRVGSGIAHIYGRDPIASVQAARTLSEFSNGRFLQGLGLSHPVASQMRSVPWEDPVIKARSYLTAMRGPVPVHTPAEAPAVPIYLAAHGPKMMAVAAELADGAMTYMQTPESCAEARAILGPHKALNLVLPSCLSTDPEGARAAGRRAIAIHLPLPAYQRVWARRGFEPEDWADGGSDRLVDTYVNWGDLDAVSARIREYLDAGVTNVIIGANPDTNRPGSAAELVDALAPAAGA